MPALPAADTATDLILGQFEPWWFWIEGGLLFLLGCLGLAPLRIESDLGSHGTVQLTLRRAALVLIGGFALLGLGAGLLFRLRLGPSLTAELGTEYLWRWGPFCLAALLLGLSLRLLAQRFVHPRLSALLRALRITQPTEAPSDIRTEIDAYRAVDFQPSSFYRPGQVLVGLDQERQPVTVDLAEWREINKTVVGATRYGKGITFQIWAEQAIARGDTVIMVDPKRDRFLPQVLRQAANAAGRKFITLDLSDPDTWRTWSPFSGGSAVDRRARFFDIMELTDRGTDPDTAEYVAEASGTRLKKIARVERTEINRSGGESWARQRALGDQEEPLIPVNTVLALPRRVAVLLRPRHLAQVVCVSPVPVPDEAKAGIEPIQALTRSRTEPEQG